MTWHGVSPAQRERSYRRAKVMVEIERKKRARTFLFSEWLASREPRGGCNDCPMDETCCVREEDA